MKKVAKSSYEIFCEPVIIALKIMQVTDPYLFLMGGNGSLGLEYRA
jgi:hypothetical protein